MMQQSSLADHGLVGGHRRILSPPLQCHFRLDRLVDRAEIDEAMGQTVRARYFYGRFLKRQDIPVPALVYLWSGPAPGLVNAGSARPRSRR